MLIDRYIFLTEAKILPNMIYDLLFATLTEWVQVMGTHPVLLVEEAAVGPHEEREGGSGGMANVDFVLEDDDAETLGRACANNLVFTKAIEKWRWTEFGMGTESKKPTDGGPLRGLHLCDVSGPLSLTKVRHTRTCGHLNALTCRIAVFLLTSCGGPVLLLGADRLGSRVLEVSSGKMRRRRVSLPDRPVLQRAIPDILRKQKTMREQCQSRRHTWHETLRWKCGSSWMSQMVARKDRVGKNPNELQTKM